MINAKSNHIAQKGWQHMLFELNDILDVFYSQNPLHKARKSSPLAPYVNYQFEILNKRVGNRQIWLTFVYIQFTF